MSREQEKERRKALDDFWDLTELSPKSSRTFGRSRSTDATEISFAPPSPVMKKEVPTERDTVITRYIPSHGGQTIAPPVSFEQIQSYVPDGSLLHKVTLKKLKCSYRYYGEFLADALRYLAIEGVESPMIPYFSYVPQYNQLSREQLDFYFWFRTNCRRRIAIKTDVSYLFLYIYELINLGERLDMTESQSILVWLWLNYHKSFPTVAGKLADWICDFSLIHRLPAPSDVTSELVRSVISMREFYIPISMEDPVDCTRSLLRYCTSYDFRTSKFATEETLPLFEIHMFGALLQVVRRFSADGKFLSGFSLEDSRMVRDAYVGALCVAEQKYRIEVEYCSFSRSNELRFLVGDLVKYAENKLRAHLGIKSRMTVYSLSTEMRSVLDEYFATALPHAAKRKSQPQAYEALYDLPVKPLSLSLAAKIEEDSWDTTRELTEAFETPAEPTPVTVPIPGEVEAVSDTEESPFGGWKEPLLRLLRGERGVIEASARSLGKMADTLADEINEVAFDLLGDAILEQNDEFYEIIEDYKSELEDLL